MTIFKSVEDVEGFKLAYPAGEIRLSHSTLETFKSCPRKFEFSKLYNNPKYEESTATRCGTALHEGFQEYLISRNVESAIWKMMQSYPWEHGISPMKDRSAESCYATLMEMINKFDVNRYELAYVQDADGNNIPCIELPFRINFKRFDSVAIGGLNGEASRYIPMYYVGYIDLIVYDKELQEFLVIDIKTTTDSSEDPSAKYEYSSQCVPYSLMLNQILGLPVGSLRVGYFVANISTTDPKARLYTYFKTEDDLSDWAYEMEFNLTSLREYINCSMFPRYGGYSCVAYKHKCKYFDLCKLRNNKRIMRSLFFEGEQDEPKLFEPLITVNIDLQELMR